MTRAVSKFEVLSVQPADLTSDDPLLRCDRATLRQVSVPRRAPIQCRALTEQEVDKYTTYVSEVNAMELFDAEFDRHWVDFKGLSSQDVNELFLESTLLQNFHKPRG